MAKESRFCVLIIDKIDSLPESHNDHLLTLLHDFHDTVSVIAITNHPWNLGKHTGCFTKKIGNSNGSSSTFIKYLFDPFWYSRDVLKTAQNFNFFF